MRIQGLVVSNHRESDRGGAKRAACDYDSIPVEYYDAVYRRAGVGIAPGQIAYACEHYGAPVDAYGLLLFAPARRPR